jgi:peptidoglycan/LPS O-acetylase OafA/YrhL
MNAIDGARGFLALGVALHHAVIYYHFIRTGEWVAPPSRFYTLAGQLSVACFFTITGYLFWRKIVWAKGRLDFADLMKGRFFRLAPLYLVTALIAITIIFVRSGATLNIPLPQYLLQIVQNLAAGIFPFVNMNGESASFTVTAGVTWTLQYEWQFYFVLPVLAIFARNERLHLAFAITMLFMALALHFMGGGLQFTLYAFFACGMIMASLEAAGYCSNCQCQFYPHYVRAACFSSRYCTAQHTKLR